MALTSGDYSATVATAPPVRRRRHPDEARAEIIGAARQLLQEAPLAALSVSAVMAGTTLSRKSFYVYFDDLGALLVALVRPLREGADAAMRSWQEADDPVVSGRAALRAAAELYRAHGPLLEAILRSPTADPDVLAARDELVAPLRTIALQILERAGEVPADARPLVAAALATMNVHTLLDRAPGASDQELDALTTAISVIWERTALPSEQRR